MTAVCEFAQLPTALAYERENLLAQVSARARRQRATNIFAVGRREIEVLHFSQMVPTLGQFLEGSGNFCHYLAAFAHQFFEVAWRVVGEHPALVENQNAITCHFDFGQNM